VNLAMRLVHSLSVVCDLVIVIGYETHHVILVMVVNILFVFITLLGWIGCKQVMNMDSDRRVWELDWPIVYVIPRFAQLDTVAQIESTRTFASRSSGALLT